MKKILTLIIIFTIIQYTFGQAYKIDVNIGSLKNQNIILGHNFNDQLIPDDTITLNSKGFGSFTGNELYPGGMYFLFLPNMKKFDFLLDKDQQFSISADTIDFINTVSFKGSEENIIFVEFQRLMEKRAKEIHELSENKAKNKGNKEVIKEIDKKIKLLNLSRKDDFDKVISAYPDMFISKFLKATQKVEVPKTITDRKQQYFYFRNHYFDQFDVSDPRLLRTPIYQGTIDMFLDKVLMQHPDTLIAEIDILIEKSKANDELLRFMMVHLFNKYSASQIMTSENVLVHIAEKYYCTSLNTWSKPEFISELKRKVSKKKKCLIGINSPNIDFRQLPLDTFKINDLISKNQILRNDGLEVEKSSADSIIKYNLKVELLKEYIFEFEDIGSLYTTDAEYTIIWFWTPDCSHCRKDTPKFYDLYLEKKLNEKNVQVISMFMQKDITEWKKFAKINEDWLIFLKKHQMPDWINAWNPFDPFRRNFDIESSPVIYILDKNKKIIAKKVGYEQAIDIVENELKRAKS